MTDDEIYEIFADTIRSMPREQFNNIVPINHAGQNSRRILELEGKITVLLERVGDLEAVVSHLEWVSGMHD